MKRTKKKSTNDTRYQKLEKVIQIKLSHRQDRTMNPQGFVKIIEQEYASKYLEMLNIEPSNANIKMLLKNYPLKKCDIIPFWNENDANNPDYIQIVPHKQREKNAETKNASKQPKSLEKEESISQPQEQQTNQQKQEEDEVQRFELSFHPQDIQNRYIYPFNQNKQKKENIAIMNQHISQITDNNDIYYLPKLQAEMNMIYEQEKFQFPFSKINLLHDVIVEVQNPIKAKLDEILDQLKGFVIQFPKNLIPIDNKEKTSLKITEKDYVETIKLISSEPMGYMIGLFSHMAYHIVLGEINPVQVEPLVKKQIFVNMMEQIQILKQNANFSDKTWKFLVYPMILLTLKMQVENIFQNQYKLLFQQENVGQLLMDKIWYLLDNIFDPTLLEGRFIFLEKDQRYTDQKVAQEKNYLQKRLYSISPSIEMLMPNPKESHARVLLLKNRQYFEKNIPTKEVNLPPQHNFQEIKKLTKKLDHHQYDLINHSYNQKNYQIIKNKLQNQK